MMPANPRIILLGPRGGGKSSVGRLLAERLKSSFLDLDDEIKRQSGRRIAELFADVGDPGFRELESAALRQALASDVGVIATGGGVVLRAPNRELLRNSQAMRVLLIAPPEILWHRVRADPDTLESRPSLTRMHAEAEIRHVLQQRLPFYEQVATHTIDTSLHTAAEVVDEIIHAIQRHVGA